MYLTDNIFLQVTDIRALQYKPDGTINYKLRFTEDWQPLPQRRNIQIQPIEIDRLPNLYSSRLKITAKKFSDLQDLKSSVPDDYHYFYDHIPHH